MARSAGRIFVYSIFGFLLGIYLFASSFRAFKRKRLIENTPTSKIRSIAMGPVEIFGKVISNKSDLVKTPFSNKDCSFCKWTIEEYQRRGKSSKWVVIKSGQEGSYFYVKDDTGHVLINPQGAWIDIPRDFETKKVDSHISNWLESHAIDQKGVFFKRKLRFREYYLEQGDPIYIMGYAGDNPFVEDTTAGRNEADIMIQQGKNNFFYITDKDEKSVLTNFTWKAYSKMFGGAALSIICLLIIVGMIGLL